MGGKKRFTRRSLALGVLAANQYDERENDRKDQQDMNETAHCVPREHCPDPQQQQKNHTDFEHGSPF